MIASTFCFRLGDRERRRERLQRPIAKAKGETYHIGPRAVRDSRGDLIVINWAAPVAKPYYEATPKRPRGLTLRRRLRTERERLLGIADEAFGTSVVAPTIGDLLLEELGRERTDEMRQIAATIQEDQYRIIERPIDSTTIVQGGPGTGKTVIGLHRAALLLYRYQQDLVGARVLIVGPNPVFMQYIAYVLPSLGETAADQVAVDSLGDVSARIRDDSMVARVKGHERMAEVLRRAVVDRVRAPAEEISFKVHGVGFSVRAETISALLGAFDAREQSYVSARTSFRSALESEVRRAYETEFTRQRPGTVPTALTVRTLQEFGRALDRIWPAITAPELIRQLLGSEERLERAAKDILTDTERRILYKKPVERLEQIRWSSSDVPLVDEAQWLIERSSRRFGHVVLDEAQDLTPMQLRMVGRRVQQGSVTVLGDLAQATGLWSYTSWHEISDHMGLGATVDVQELTYAYRVPKEIMDIALPVLKLTAPSIAPPVAFRPGGTAPSFALILREARAEEAVDRAVTAHAGGGTAAIIAPTTLLDELRSELLRRKVEFGDAEHDQLAASIELLDPIASKGLEFDHVVLVEPAMIVREAFEGQGYKELYVALTRATQTVACVHSEPLPWPLG